ncbi:hypothetical protein OHU45_08745 [Streptomyces tubercidicus]|uniref:hypothetical protein n=1 Tax=Streptomyces tubercidicus TaxID=47759 RepID=UPI002E1043E8|nr:hypothetical protein OG761_08605 [Streptomyces tubercidicus]WSX23406.1 hypothetical protein OG690_28655 [Streptomyces tubercidicus]
MGHDLVLDVTDISEDTWQELANELSTDNDVMGADLAALRGESCGMGQCGRPPSSSCSMCAACLI